MKRKALVVGLIAAGLIGSAAAGYSAGIVLDDEVDFAPEALAVTKGSAAAATDVVVAPPDFASVVALCAPAVVSISLTEHEKLSATGRYSPHLDGHSPYSVFSERFQLPFPPDELPIRGIGSGFIVGADGIIVTTAHMVNGAKRIDVRLADKREFEAKVVGVDERSDVAVLRIDATNLPTVKLGSSADMRVGDWVVAIGSPFGLESSVSRGIVSAKSRALPGETYVPFIQTDVPANPGNSGGPLFNVKGEVIGLSSHIFSRTGDYQGLSFAIPIDIASYVTAQLLQHGKVTRGRLGVSAQEVTQGLADSFGLDKLDGVLVNAVEPGGPAAIAGLEPGDIILALDERGITNTIDLPAQVAEIKPGTSIKLTVLRRGNTKAINVTVGQLRDAQSASADAGR